MKKNISAAVLVLFAAAGLLLGALYDLDINRAVYSPKNIFGIFMESVGFWPLYLPVALLFAVYAKSRHLYKKIIGTVLCAATLCTLLAVGLKYTSKRGAGSILVGLAFVLCCCAVLLIIRVNDMKILRKLWFLGVAGSAYMVLNNIVINILKLLWQRPRFDEMMNEGSLTSFRPWFSLFGPGGSSFPSGHTGAACGIFMLLALCSLFKFWHKKYALMLTLCWGYVGLMATGRILIGRHFLSDTVAAAFIGFILFYAMSNTPPYKKALEAVAEKNE